MSLALVVTAAAVAGASGVPGLFLVRTSRFAEGLATIGMAAAALVGLAGAALAFHGAEAPDTHFPWPATGNATIGLDALSAFFLPPIFLVGGLGSIYGLAYWTPTRRPSSARALRLFWGTLVAGMVLVVIARHAMAFLIGWEVMALSAFFLVSVEHRRLEARSAGWLYLIATHVGTLTLFALFVLWRVQTGSYALRPLPTDALDPATTNVLFFVALFAFGLKAGMMPLHFWLPDAHANAPTHVSAMLSGVVLKMGIYGLVRFLSLIPEPPIAWGALVLLLGAVSGVFGVVFALGQHDLKRLLAYHSVENVGIILMGLGLALLGRSTERPEWVWLGLAACLLHVWNHCLFKSLLFFGAGSVIHATHTRQIDRLGGLAKTMPWTAAAFLAGAVAICGLPPLNGFVSELFLYLGLLDSITAGGNSAPAVFAPILAAIGALAVACFVKAFGAVFLGAPRTRAARDAYESPAAMIAPMVVLALCCAAIGTQPILVAPILASAIVVWMPAAAAAPLELASLAPLHAVGLLAAALLALVGVAAGAALRGGSRAPTAVTWDCGYAAPTARMQYTASSFAQTIVRLSSWLLRPHVRVATVRGLWPRTVEFETHVDDAVLDRVLRPGGAALERGFAWARRLQGGLTQHYVLYILAALLLMLGTLVPFDEYVTRVFAR